MIDTARTYLENLLLSTGLGAATSYTLTLISMFVCLGLICWLIGMVCHWIIVPVVRSITKRTPTKLDDIFINNKLLKAATRTIPGIIFLSMLPQCLHTGTEAEPLIYIVALRIAQVYATLTFVWVFTTLLNNLLAYANTNDALKDYHLEGIVQFLKLIIYFFGALITIAILFNQPPLTLFAGLGAAATVLLLIFKDSILGLVASIQISINRMIKKDDWIIMDGKNINGNVEEINLTTVKIRNFDNSVSMVPPYTLVSESFQNWGRMHETGKRRVKRSILIDAHTVHFTNEEKTMTNLTLFRKHAEEYLHAHPRIVNSEWILVRQLEPTAHGIPLELWFYLDETEFVHFEQLASEIMEHFIAILPEFDLHLFQYQSEPFKG